jgi:hypothetical protein
VQFRLLKTNGKPFSKKMSGIIKYNDVIKKLNLGDPFFPYFAGFVEGDCWFTVSKNGKYLKYELGIELSIRDLKLLQYIQILLEGIGTIDFRTRNGSKMVIFRVRSKSDLIGVILPIFDKYPLLLIRNMII